jgi:uncharacterized flavoprotein (TIGR03862 family)
LAAPGCYKSGMTQTDMPPPTPPRPEVAVIGGGPAGLMAAEIVARAGAAVTVIDRMPSLGRKLLMAGRGGLNLTHSEPLPGFLARYGAARERMAPIVEAFPPDAVVEWCHGLGQPTFVGSSGRIFPKAMKASPLLRAWLGRLDSLGVTSRLRCRWLGWDGADLLFEGGQKLAPAATVLALGGASWPRLGSDGAWAAVMERVVVTPLRPANMGFLVAWSEQFRRRFEGVPIKRVALTFKGATVRGEAVATADGIEGGAIYALSAPLRDALAAGEQAVVSIDLRPDLSPAALAARLARPRGSASLSSFLRKEAGLPPIGVGLVQEALHSGSTPDALPTLIKALPLKLVAPKPIERAISTAGGIAWGEVDERLMLHRRPGTFVAGEMLDWEAPTGGYLLQGCLSTGAAAGKGVLAWLEEIGAWPS